MFKQQYILKTSAGENNTLLIKVLCRCNNHLYQSVVESFCNAGNVSLIIDIAKNLLDEFLGLLDKHGRFQVGVVQP